MAVESPCVKRCEVDSTRQACRGCGRTLDEIGNWSKLSPAERRRIMAELPARRLRASVDGPGARR